jgi:MFS family permease
VLRRLKEKYLAAYAGIPKAIWLLSATVFVNRAGTMVMPFMTLYLTRERGLPVRTAGWALALYGLGAMAGAYAGGRVADRFGPRWVMIASLIATGFAFQAFSVLSEPQAILPAMFALAFIMESYRPAASTALGQVAAPPIRARSFVLLRLAANLGMTVGPALGGFLAVRSYRWLFVVDGITCWIAAGVLWFFLSDALKSSAERAREAAKKPGQRRPFKDGPFLAFCGLKLIQAMVFFQLFSTWPLYFRNEYGYREDGIGAFFALNGACVVLFEMQLVRVLERFDRIKVIGFGVLLLCAGFGLMPWGDTRAWAVLTVLVWTFGEMMAMPLSMAVVADRASDAHRGGYMATIAMTFSLAYILAPLAGTAVYERVSPDALWHGIGILGIPLLLGFRRLSSRLSS